MLAGVMLAVAPGCHIFHPAHQPAVYNPFPQLSRVAVAPFFNQSDEPTVDGRKFALAYYAELQAVPGFEVVPLGVVEEAILDHRIDLSHPGEARRLARVLGVDAVVIGSVTDYNPYYPPRCGLRVEWYAANPGFHEIPPGYGLPWGTPEEEFIPEPLKLEAEMALARAQLATQTPACELPPIEEPTRIAPSVMLSPLAPPLNPNTPVQEKHDVAQEEEAVPLQASHKRNDSGNSSTLAAQYEALAEEELPEGAGEADSSLPTLQSDQTAAAGTTRATDPPGAAPLALPPNWPDASSFMPQPPSAECPPCIPNVGPVMMHTRIYHGHDGDFTEALATYYRFRNDARFGGWQNYLQRSDDFIRFCCHMHIAEMLTARGGAGKSRVVWHASDCR